MQTTSHHCHLNLIVASALPSRLVVFLRRCHSPLPLPLSAVKCCHHHQTPLSPPPLYDVFIVYQSLLSIAATAATAATAAGPPPPLPPPPLLNSPLSIAKQSGNNSTTPSVPANGSTNVRMFTSPDDLGLFNLSTVFEVCNVGQGILQVASTYSKMFCPIISFWEVVPPASITP
jgi:hypothetical protein